ncbi:glycosyltransferase family 25 protein [Pseudaminobacter arsenicus]|uniref:Glycosyltransferase family 25 protein n=1 Tax=Borborobacter arsenicus TaxID=1851146 RepID=A0A432V459_9HYPH|nr:glycosyltransferase family 25 protein [Pseudaminobacter arsenicus]RUM96918.1 glycosyltransferase family 25 protein [Pseudaminobacter arsenicus]
MSPRIPVFVINLDRSPERLAKIRKRAEEIGIDLIRVRAVDGAQLTPEHSQKVDHASFARDHGKRILPAEIGCYLSHLDALQIVADSPESHAVIVEDDVQFNPDFLAFLDDLVALEGWDVVKLVNHRTRGFVSHAKVNDRYQIGRCAHGPCGSSAAYMVTRQGAGRLLAALNPMGLPYDVALERGWAGGYELFSTDQPVVRLSPEMGSTIFVGESPYRKATFPAHKRLRTLLFRSRDYLRRIRFALASTRLRRRQA